MTEQRYTLEQAKAELARRTCVERGHDFDVVADWPLGSPRGDRPVQVRCDRCHRWWPIADIAVTGAVRVAITYGGNDAAHHLRWVIDQMVRYLTGADYAETIPDGWDEGTVP